MRVLGRCCGDPYRRWTQRFRAEERTGLSVEESDLGSKDFGFLGEAEPRVASGATWWPRPLLWGLQLLSQRGLWAARLFSFLLEALALSTAQAEPSMTFEIHTKRGNRKIYY